MMIRNLLVPIFLACALVFTGCASKKTTPSRPDWVTNPPSKAGLIYGVGGAEAYGNTNTAMQQAKEVARLDLLAQLRVTVQGETRTSMRFDDSGTTSSIERMVQHQTSSLVEKIEMTGIEIVETWVDPSGKEVWALARMNRAKTESELLFKLSNLEDKILARDIPQGDKLDRIRAALPLLKELEERDRILELLSLVSMGEFEEGTGKGQQVEALRKDLRTLLSSLVISIEGRNDTARKMKPAIAKTLTSMGFNLHSFDADLILDLDLELHPFRQGNHSYCLGEAMAEVRTPDGRTLYVLKESGRGASGVEFQAVSKAVDDVSKKIADSLAQKLFQNP